MTRKNIIAVSTRLRNFDYSQAGAYFVTVVTSGRKCLLGEIANQEMRVSDAGRLVQSVWYDLPKHYPRVKCDAFVVMPTIFTALSFWRVLYR